MNKLSEYVPIIIILVSVILSIVGKMKSQGKVTEETMLPGRTADEPVEEEKPAWQPISSYRRIAEEKPQKQVLRKPEIKQGEATGHLSPTPMIIEPEEEDSTFQFEEDDVVKAIIYAEIINKKNY